MMKSAGNRVYDIDNLIVETAEAGCKLQTYDGAMPPGCNGPHKHNMTPARNTSHWAITFLYAFKTSREEKFRRAAIQCLDLLVSPLLRPMGGAFWHRCHSQRNSFNGLIGQSWSIEALYYGWKILGEEHYHAVALEVFSQHVYEDTLGLWYQLDLDGSASQIEITLNQQVWFAAMGAHLAKGDDEIIDTIRDFLSRLPEKVMLRRYGLLPRAVLLSSDIKSKLKRLLRESVLQNTRQRAEVEHGYHLFTLCGLAHLFERIPNHEFWSTHLFKKALDLSFDPAFLKRLTQNRYGFPYNVPGFELPYIYSVLRPLILREDAKDLCQKYLSYQLDMHYNVASQLLELNSEDPETLAARFYEVCRIPRAFFSTDDAKSR